MSDGLFSLVEWAPQHAVTCIPATATREQLVRVMPVHLQNNPAALHFRAYELVHEAFQKAFPCPKQ